VVTGHSNIDFATLTDVGVRRSHNQDAFAVLPAPDAEQWQQRGHIFLVADGMGAHAVGELASKLAADSIPHIYTKYAHEEPAAALRKAFVEANLSIHNRGQQNREFEGMGTTGTALLLRPEGAWIAHVGDSRAYRIREGKIEQLSFDHSLVWELARRQHINPEELHGVPTNVIIRSLGPEPLVQVDIEGPHPLQAGDIFVLCSDGLSGQVCDRKIGAIATTLPPAEACRLLVDLANLQGGPDNVTAIVVHVRDEVQAATVQSSASRPFWPQWLPWPLASLLLGILLAVGAIALTFARLPGRLPVFLLAALALVAGLVGLFVQARKEREQQQREGGRPRLKVYRSADARVDRPMLDRLAEAAAALEKRLREHKWEANWPCCQQHETAAAEFLRQGELSSAFREYCRAVRVLAEAFQRQRGKDEVFPPLWDKA
jgi:serine/threonine protein phosphatase PrpC